MNKNQRRPVEQVDFRIQTPAPLIAWKPTVVLAPTLGSVTERDVVTAGEPALRPEALRARIGATRALLQSLAAAQAALDSNPGPAGVVRDGERARVAATAEAYRLESMLDRVLVRTFDEVTALMNERGLA